MSNVSPPTLANGITVNHRQPLFRNKNKHKKHSYLSLGKDFYVETTVEFFPDARLVLFNKALAQQLNLILPSSNQHIEQLIIKHCAWFKAKQINNHSTRMTQTFFSTRYQDSDDKSEGSALGDGRAIWIDEIITTDSSGHIQYLDVVLKGTGATDLAWLNHPRESHKDGQVSLTEAVHEYLYSDAAIKNGINAAGILAVIELPFLRKVDNDKAAIVVRIGNHLRFSHYCYFADNATQLKKIFEYGLKRDMGLPLSHPITLNDVQQYLDFIILNLSADAAVYFDIHAVHGSPTFGNITSNGGTIDFATFVYTDAHHNNYSYMSEGANQLGGEWGQTEQFFNLFSNLIKTLKKSHFDFAADIMPVEYFLKQFNRHFEHVLTQRWLLMLGLSKQDITALSYPTREYFYDIVKLLYEQEGLKKIRFNKRKIRLAAFEPRKILSGTMRYIENFDNDRLIWTQLFSVERKWGTYNFTSAKPYIGAYRTAVLKIINELNASSKHLDNWQQQSIQKTPAKRNEPGADFFYDSERHFASKDVLQKINTGILTWHKISEVAAISALKLTDQ